MEEMNPLFKNVTQMTLERQYKFNLYIAFKLVIMIEIAYVLLFGAACFIFKDDAIIFTTILVAASLACLLFPFLYYSQIKKKLRKLMQKSPLQDDNNVVTFSFYESSVNALVTRFGDLTNQATLRYENLIKIVHYKNLLIVYIGINQAYLLDCDCMEIGTFKDLTDFLKSKLGNKFKVSKRSKRTNG